MAAAEANSMSSKPTIAMSSGTRTPWRIITCSTPRATRSFAQMTAVGRGPEAEDALAGVAAVGDVEVLDADVVQHVVAACLPSDAAMSTPVAPLVGRPDVRGARDVADPLVPEGEQVAHRELAAAQVVGADAAFVVADAVGDPHDRGPARPQALDGRAAAAPTGTMSMPGDAPLLEHADVRLLLGRVLVAVADDHRVAGLVRRCPRRRAPDR